MKMNQIEKDNQICNIRLMRIIGVHQLLNPKTTNYFGFNPYKVMVKNEIVLNAIYISVLLLGAYYIKHDIKELLELIMQLVGVMYSTFKFYVTIKNSKIIWSCLEVLSVNFLSYKKHKREVLKIARNKSTLITTICFVIWITLILVWCITPLHMTDVYYTVMIKNRTRHYRLSAVNFVYPINENVHKTYFAWFYTFEVMTVVLYGHSLIIFDTIMSFICIAIKYQLKMIANSYSVLGVRFEKHSKDDGKKLKNNDLDPIFDLHQLIKDQQYMHRKIKDIYQVLEPGVFVQLGIEFTLLVMQPFVIIINSVNGLSLLSTLRHFITILCYVVHLFITCYMFNTITEQMERINFAMYSSNWTEMSLRFRKILLLAIKMHDAQKLKLQISLNKVVNIEMFATVIQTVYKITSVLGKSYKKP